MRKRRSKKRVKYRKKFIRTKYYFIKFRNREAHPVLWLTNLMSSIEVFVNNQNVVSPLVQ